MLTKKLAYHELAMLLRMTRTLLAPMAIDGGGERAVLEARACGAAVEVDQDNIKLKELTTSPIWNQVYYASRLEHGACAILEASPPRSGTDIDNLKFVVKASSSSGMKDNTGVVLLKCFG